MTDEIKANGQAEGEQQAEPETEPKTAQAADGSGSKTADAEAATEQSASEPQAETSEAEAPPAEPAEAKTAAAPRRKSKKDAAEEDGAAEQAAEAPAAPAEAEAAPRNPNLKWYIIHSYSGFERKVKESLETRIQAFGLQNKFGRIVIPTEPVTEIRGGKKYTTERAFLPGYVLVEIEMDLSTPDGQNLWHVVKNTPRVTGFLGAGNQPTPLTEEEVNSIVFRVETGKDKPKLKVKFQKNESVRITEGPFANFNGVVDEVNEDRETLKIMVTIFGRSTPVELNFSQVEKVA